MIITCTFFQNEFKMNIYLNYVRIEDYKQFHFHFVIFRVYCHINHCFSRFAKKSFALLRNVKSFEFKNEYEKLLKKYDLAESNAEENKNVHLKWQNYIFADVLYHFVNELRDSFTLTNDKIFAIIMKFKELFSKRQKLFVVDLNDIIWFKLNFLKEENALEIYNWAFNVFKSLKTMIATFKWMFIFEKFDVNEFSNTSIESDFIFQWMKKVASNKKSFFMNNVRVDMKKNKFKRVFLFRHVRKSQIKLKKKLKKFEKELEFENLNLSKK